MSIKQTTPLVLYSYWNEIRAGRLAPQRLEIEPSRIASILSETFMLERGTAGGFSYRLAGTRLCELFGRELRGTEFLDGWVDEDRRALTALLATAAEQGACIFLTVEGASDDRHRVDLDCALLPLLHSDGTVTRIIGAMSPTSAPFWLGSDPLRSRRLVRHQLLWPDGKPHGAAARAGRAAPHLAPAALRHESSQRRRFRVVEGGRQYCKPDKH